MVEFKKAVKSEARGRMALVGPAGSGKSWTMLTAARALVGPTGKIAAIDTEHGSLSKYADIFDFDVIELDTFSPDNFLNALKAAENAGYSALCCDSLSHFWTGKDGALEFVDMAAKRHKDGMGGWKEFRPHERAMIDAMIASPCHILVTMRTKTEYQEQVNPNTGKKQRVKIGLAPVQREGLEYEFDFVGYMDEENTLIIDKTRCSFYAHKALSKPAAKDFAPFAEWLKGAPAVAAKPIPEASKEIPKQPAPIAKPNVTVEPELLKETAKQPPAAPKPTGSQSTVIVPMSANSLVSADTGKPYWTIKDIKDALFYTTEKTIYELANKSIKEKTSMSIDYQMMKRGTENIPFVLTAKTIA